MDECAFLENTLRYNEFKITVQVLNLIVGILEIISEFCF